MELRRYLPSLYSLGYLVCMICVMMKNSQQSLTDGDFFSALTAATEPHGRRNRLQTYRPQQRNTRFSHLEELKLIHEYIYAINRLAEPLQHETQKIEKKQEYGHFFLRQNRAAALASMALVQSRYEAFYKDLSMFANELSSHLNSTAPTGLSNILVLKYILQPGDRAFPTLDERMVTQKFYLIHDVLTAALQRVPPYLVPGAQGWFDDVQFTLEFDMFMLKGPIVELQGRPPSTVSAVAGGAGGINKPVQASLGPDVLAKLQDLITTLQGMPVAKKQYYGDLI